jgi:hypothetical protein
MFLEISMQLTYPWRTSGAPEERMDEPDSRFDIVSDPVEFRALQPEWEAAVRNSSG